jgi:GT2 family glycosyltransferase
MKSYFECNLFQQNFKPSVKFTVSQNEINLKQKLQEKKFSFEKKEVIYNCNWVKHDEWDNNKPTILMPIRNNSDLLSITMNNFITNKVNKVANIIVIDDRSSEDLYKVCKSIASYLKIDNNKGFNFSMLMNIGANICYSMGTEHVFLWNCDLWCPNPDSIIELLRRHKENKSVISGSKLLYPPKDMSLRGEIDTKNIKKINKNMLQGKWRETVQFGGDAWLLTPENDTLIHPIHTKRFANPNNPIVNCDRGSCFITGALHLWNLEKFIELGGLNPSLARNFQDADICLKAMVKGYMPMYFGKELYFYHDESAVFNNLIDENKFNKQMQSDNILFGKIWNDKIMEIIF